MIWFPRLPLSAFCLPMPNRVPSPRCYLLHIVRHDFVMDAHANGHVTLNVSETVDENDAPTASEGRNRPPAERYQPFIH